jgi:two-component system, OmpR family, sensor histidine kinase KdpD
MQKKSGFPLADRFSPLQRYFLTALFCIVSAFGLTFFADDLDHANIVMPLLLVVLLVSVNLGRDCAVFSAVLCVSLFDYLFVPPRFSFAVNDPQYLVTFFVMLMVALTTAHMASGLKQAAADALKREEVTQALYKVAKDLAGALTGSQVNDIISKFILEQTSSKSWIIETQDNKIVRDDMTRGSPFSIESHMATVALRDRRTVNSSTLNGADWASLYVPLGTSMRTYGVLSVSNVANPQISLKMIEALASLIAITLERLHYAQVAHKTELEIMSERLRSSILSALSHDIRTPLTVLVGLADSLSMVKPSLPVQALETSAAITQQAMRLSNLVSNLLEMARLNSGDVKLRYEWHHIQDVVGASLQHLNLALNEHQVITNIPFDLPLLEIDAVLMERVVSNLVENAAKYSPKGSRIEIGAIEHQKDIEIYVLDQGPGFDVNKLEEIFSLFVRGEKESNKPGFGVGLAISQVIVKAHRGNIYAENNSSGGGSVHVLLPKGTPPVLEQEESL